MISLTNYDFQWARSELVIIYPDYSYETIENHITLLPIASASWEDSAASNEISSSERSACRAACSDSLGRNVGQLLVGWMVL